MINEYVSKKDWIIASTIVIIGFVGTLIKIRAYL